MLSLCQLRHPGIVLLALAYSLRSHQIHTKKFGFENRNIVGSYQIRNYSTDASMCCQWIVTLFKYFKSTILKISKNTHANFTRTYFCQMRHRNDDTSMRCRQIHCTAHSLDHFPLISLLVFKKIFLIYWNNPISQISLFGYFHSTKNGQIDMSSSYHRKRFVSRKVRSTRNHSHSFLS